MTENEKHTGGAVASDENQASKDQAPAEALWERFLAARAGAVQHRRRRVRSRLLRSSTVLVLCVLLITGTGYLIFPEQVRVAGERLAAVRTVLAAEGIEGIEGIEEAFVEIPTPDPLTLAAAEFHDQIPFPVFLPAFIPERYELVEHVYHPWDETHGNLRSEYTSGERFMSIRQLHFGSGEFGAGIGFDKDDSRVFKVEIRGNEGTIIERQKDGIAMLTWIEGSVMYDIGGFLTVDEVQAMAESMTRI